ncbi:hypothetical protein GCM10022199_16130 [Marihabitans asiaticum]|uniref:Uncharacterized protein n=1 Tax=Marihabitans asiaticum TaxID=415218 RepID=A0A560W7Z5_9MICO|nr:hypothetical protein [Marihabitans asiaticum]TWD13699.1 hypothetical protein FB557_2329 [Marihabitans asiaticum]
MNDTQSSHTVDRRTVAKGVAWAAPTLTVMSAAPAFAASCDPVAGRIDWSSTRYTRTSNTSGTYTIPDPDGAGPRQPISLSIRQTAIGANTRTGLQTGTPGDADDDNLEVTSHQVGATGDTGLIFHQSPIYNSRRSNDFGDPGETANRSTTTFTFSEPVTNLSFTITDIDYAACDFDDGVSITSASPYSYQIVNRTYVTRNGTLATPFSLTSYGYLMVTTTPTAT